MITDIHNHTNFLDPAFDDPELRSLGADRAAAVTEVSREKYIDKALGALLKHVDEKGFMKAASEYKWYSAEWFRDSSMVAIALVQFASLMKKKGLHDAKGFKRSKEAANKIISFMFSTLSSFRPNIERGLTTDVHDEKYGLLKNHIPARFGQDRDYFRLRLPDREHTDANENENLWLRQHDSIPLLLIATEYFVKEFGYGELDSKDIIKHILPELILYMSRVYLTPCSNAWELEHWRFHAYSLASIYKGLRSSIDLLDELHAGKEYEVYKRACVEAMAKVAEAVYVSFIRDSRIYRAADNLYSEPVREVDAAEIFLFTLFDFPIEDNIRRNTVRAIEEGLFGDNVLPIRFVGDTYFHGGRWLLLGLEFAYYYLHNDEKQKAARILEYIEKKYLEEGDQLPEQEVVNPASPDRDPDNMLEKNGGKVIEDLAWSEGAYLRALSALLKDYKRF